MFEKVCEILADKFDADASTMTMDTKVKEDLNADSLDVVELMMDLEENFGVTISDEEAAKMRLRANAMESARTHGPLRRSQWLGFLCEILPCGCGLQANRD